MGVYLGPASGSRAVHGARHQVVHGQRVVSADAGFAAARYMNEARAQRVENVWLEDLFALQAKAGKFVIQIGLQVGVQRLQILIQERKNMIN